MQEAKSAPFLAIAGSVDVSVTTRAGGGLAALSMQNAGAVIDSEAKLGPSANDTAEYRAERRRPMNAPSILLAGS